MKKDLTVVQGGYVPDPTVDQLVVLKVRTTMEANTISYIKPNMHGFQCFCLIQSYVCRIIQVIIVNNIIIITEKGISEKNSVTF